MDADLIIIGGGITGVGIARDASMRGFKVILIEQNELGSGTSGYFHGTLHSGARYAVVDPNTASECWRENQILKRIVKDAVTDAGGLFLAFSDKEIAYADTLLVNCKKIGIPIEELLVEEVLKKDPEINPNLKKAFMVPDGYINGAKAISLNKGAAENLGAQFLIYHQVKAFNKNGRRINSVVMQNKQTGKEKTIKCNFVINAAGIWASQIGKLADLDIPLIANKGSMIVLKNQLSKSVLNRCRVPSDGDIIVPDGIHSILGTTSVNVTDIESHETEKWEIDKLLEEGEYMIPGLSNQEYIHVYAGVRALIRPDSNSDDKRGITRSFEILDHQKNGVDNMISVVGGKFMLYRLMAEKAMDLVCRKLNIDKPSKTAEVKI